MQDFEKKQKKDHIKQLKKDKLYDKIFDLYGKKNFLENVSSKHQKKDIKELFSLGRFEDIYLKYGEATYNKYWMKMQTKEVEDLTGSKQQAAIMKLKEMFKRKILPIFMSSTLLLPAGITKGVSYMVETNSNYEAATTYSKSLENYNNRMEQYIENLKQAELTDLQLIMKVMDDMWKDIEGYKIADKELIMYGRLTFAKENGVGVCRNMADHFTYIINEVNPEYNAKNFMTYVEFGEGSKLANIQRNIIESNDTVEETEKNEANSFNKFIGNHAITIMEIPNKDLYLVIDSTNPSIGTFENNSIKMFSNENINNQMAIGTNILLRGQYSLGITIEEIVNSYTNSTNDFETLEQEWGIEEQNKALEDIRNMKLLGIQDSTEQMEVEKSFFEKYMYTLDEYTKNNKKEEQNKDVEKYIEIEEDNER